MLWKWLKKWEMGEKHKKNRKNKSSGDGDDDDYQAEPAVKWYSQVNLNISAFVRLHSSAPFINS